MLMKPSILRIPISSFPICDVKACGSGFVGSGHRCPSNFNCRPFNGGACVNACFSGHGVPGIGPGHVVGAGIIAAVGIKIT
jgi:hypothetical protein